MSVTNRKINPFRMLSRQARTANIQNHHAGEKEAQVTTATTFNPPRKLTELLIQTARDLQVLPDVAVQALAIADDPDAKVKSLVNVVAQDVKLTTDILSLSNCSVFGSTTKVASLQQAIMRVGFRQTKNMILASCIASMMQKMDWKEEKTRDALCKHSFLTAVINSRLNSLFSLGLQGEEFTAGLIHDIGRTLLAVAIPTEFSTFDPLDFNEPADILKQEARMIGTNHTEVGGWFLQRNHLPEELVMVAQYHHNPQASPKFKRLVAVTAIADDLANYCLRQETAEYDCAATRYLEILEALGVENATDQLQNAVSSLLESAQAEVRQLIK